MALVNLVQTFERFLKEIAAECVDCLANFIVDDRFNAFKIQGSGLASHFGSGTLGKSLCESSTWLDCEEVNDRFRKLLADSPPPERGRSAGDLAARLTCFVHRRKEECGPWLLPRSSRRWNFLLLHLKCSSTAIRVWANRPSFSTWPHASAVYPGSGSIGVIGHARTGLLVAQDRDDEQRILAVSKCNMAVKPASLRFALENHDGVSRIAWRGTAPHQANHLVERPPSADQRQRRLTDRACQEFIRRLLGGYAMPIRSVKMECQDGFNLWTTEWAAHNLGLVWTRDYGMNMWSLPKAVNASAA